MKTPQGWATGRILKEGRLREHNGKPFIEATMEMDEPVRFDRGDYRERVDICTERDDELAIVTLLKPGARVRVDGTISSTMHIDKFGQRVYTRTRITGSITLLEEAAP